MKNLLILACVLLVVSCATQSPEGQTAGAAG